MAWLTGKAQQEYLHQRTLQLQAAAAAQQEAVRPQKSFLQQRRTDAWSLTKHACLLTLALLGASNESLYVLGPIYSVNLYLSTGKGCALHILVSKLGPPPLSRTLLANEMEVIRSLCLAGVAAWAGEYLQLAAYACVALLCAHVAALATIQVRHASLDELTLAPACSAASSGWECSCASRKWLHAWILSKAAGCLCFYADALA